MNPFAGPSPLSSANPIFGRDRELRELSYLLTSQRIVALHSPSGAGKSSLLNARGALLDRMKRNLQVFPVARVKSEAPATAANRFVWSAITDFTGGPHEFTSFAQFAADRISKPSLLVIDQFEEILRVDPIGEKNIAVKREFFRQLGDMLLNGNVWALLVLRDDYLATLDPYRRMLPTHLQNRYRIDLLSRDAAAQAMQGTARSGGRKFSDDALKALVSSLAKVKVTDAEGKTAERDGDYIEPLQLQVVCRDLWGEGGDEITLEEVKRRGDVGKALAGFYSKAVAAAAEKNVRAEYAIRQWIETNLITSRLSTPRTRDQVRRTEPATAGLDNTYLDRLIDDAHLLRREERLGAPWLELAHDRLIDPVIDSNDHWFEDNLTEWEKRARSWQQERDEGLKKTHLVTGPERLRAAQWAKENPESRIDLAAYLTACAAQQKEVDRKRREVLRLRVAMALCLLLAIGAAFAAWDAREATRDAQARLLLGISTETAGDPMQSLLWAGASLRTKAVPQNLSRVLDLLNGFPVVIGRVHPQYDYERDDTGVIEDPNSPGHLWFFRGVQRSAGLERWELQNGVVHDPEVINVSGDPVPELPLSVQGRRVAVLGPAGVTKVEDGTAPRLSFDKASAIADDSLGPPLGMSPNGEWLLVGSNAGICIYHSDPRGGWQKPVCHPDFRAADLRLHSSLEQSARVWALGDDWLAVASRDGKSVSVFPLARFSESARPSVFKPFDPGGNLLVTALAIRGNRLVVGSSLGDLQGELDKVALPLDPRAGPDIDLTEGPVQQIVLPSAGSETVVRIHRGGDGTTEVLDNVGKRWAIVPGEFPQLSGSGDIVSSVIGSSYFLFDLRGSAQSLEGADLCMGASADGSTMLCLGHLRKPDEFAAIWNTQSGRIERRLAVHYPRSPEKGRLTFEGRLNASGSIVIEQSASEAFLTDLRSGAGWTLTSPLGYSRTSFSVDADGRTMAALDKNGALVLADARTGHIERTWPGLLSAEQYNVTLSIDSKGDRIAALDSDLLRLVDTHSGRLRQRPNNGFHKAAFSADGRSLLTYLNQANDDQVEVFSTEDLAAQPIRFRLSRALSEVVAFSEGRIIGVKRGVLHHSAPLDPSAMLSDLCHRLDSMNLMREGWTQRAGNTPYVSVCPRQDTPQGNKP